MNVLVIGHCTQTCLKMTNWVRSPLWVNHRIQSRNGMIAGTSDWSGQISPAFIQCLCWCKTGWAACTPCPKIEKLNHLQICKPLGNTHAHFMYAWMHICIYTTYETDSSVFYKRTTIFILCCCQEIAIPLYYIWLVSFRLPCQFALTAKVQSWSRCWFGGDGAGDVAERPVSHPIWMAAIRRGLLGL